MIGAQLQQLTIRKAIYSFGFKYIASPLILIATTLYIYYPTLKYPFLFDDGPNILKFYNIRNLTFNDLFFNTTRWISFWLNTINYRLSKFDPIAYRAFNLSFHIISGLLVFYIFMFLLAKTKSAFIQKYHYQIAFFTSIMFLLHPVQTQTVCYVVQGQLEGLATMFILVTLAFFLLAAQVHQLALKTFLYLCCFLSAFLLTGTKEIAIVAPLLILLVDYFFLSQSDVTQLKSRLWVHGVLFFGMLSIYIYFMKPSFFLDIVGLKYEAHNNVGNILTQDPQESILPFNFFISQFKVILHYIWIFMWPFNISVEYDWKLSESITSADVVWPLLVLLGIAVATVYTYLKNKASIIVFSACWFFIALAPRSTIIPSSELMADYKTYLASIGYLLLLSIALIWLINKLLNKLEAHFMVKCLAACVGISLLMLGTHHRHLVWSNGLKFWQNIIANAPKKARGYNNYAIEYIEKRDFKTAITLLKQAIALEPSTYPDPYTNLANCYAILGDFDRAIETIKKTIIINRYQPDAYNSLAVFFIEQQKYDLAERAALAAIDLSPRFGKPYFNLGRVLLKKDKKEEAFKAFKYAATQTDLDSQPLAFEPYAKLSLELEQFDDAIFATKKLYAMDPSPGRLFNVGVSYFMAQQYNESRQVFIQAFAMQKSPSIIANIIESSIKLHDGQTAAQYIKLAKELNLYYPGLRVHEAEILAVIGQTQEAKKLLSQTLNDPMLPANVKHTAQALLKKLS